LTGGDQAIYNVGKRVIELIPELRRQLLYIKVFPPRFFLQLMNRIGRRFSTKTLELNFTGKNEIHVRLNYPAELTRSFESLTTRTRCAGFKGAIEAFLSFMEVSDIQIIETACVAEGAGCCEFLLSWSPPRLRKRLKNLMLFTFFRQLTLSFQQAEAARDHEIFVVTGNLQAEHRKLEAALQDLAAANKKLKELSSLDGLTSIKNRGYFDLEIQRLGRVLSRCPGEQLSLIFIDIDNFKYLNDTFGHQVGDRSLKRTAVIIDEFARRPDDFAARYGGEEFVIALPRTNNESAMEIAESLRSEVEHSLSCRPVDDYPVTISLGVGTIAIHPEAVEQDIEELITMADQGLYTAKNAGRNMVFMGPAKN